MHLLAVPLLRMGRINLWRDRFNNYWHVPMKRATKFGALAVEYTFPLNEAVNLVQSPWNSVTLEPQARNRPRMKNVRGGDEEPDVRPRRQSESFVDLKLSHHSGL